MATIDLQGGDAQRFRSTYQRDLGRDASDDELTGWLSGAYGGGSIDDRLNQITNSSEAQQRRTPQTVGQPNPGVNTTLSQPAQTRAYDDPRGNDIRGFYQNYLGREPGDDEVAKWWNTPGPGYMNGIMNSEESFQRNIPLWFREYTGRDPIGYDVNEAKQRGQYDRIRDFIANSSEAQTYARTRATNPATPTTPPGGTTTGAGGDIQSWVRSMLTGASSPQALLALEPQLNQRGIRLQKDSAGNVRGRLYLPDGGTVDVVSQWGSPWTWTDRGAGAGGVGGGPVPGDQYSDPYTQMLEQLIKSRIGSLQGGYDDSMRQQYQTGLQSRADALGKGNAQLDQLLTYLQSRFTDLKGPGYTGAENEVIRTGALDPLEHDRAAARKRMTERLSAMGHTPESGVFQMAMQEVDKEFDQIRGVTQNQLTMNDLNRREDRSQRAEILGGQLADIPDQRAREQLDVFQALENLSLIARNEDQSRSREAIGYAGGLNDLTGQRFQMAMQAAGMGGNPAQLGGMLTNMMGLNQQSAAMNRMDSNSWMSAMGAISAILMRSRGAGLSGAGI